MKKMELTGYSASGFGEFLANLTVLDEDFDEASGLPDVITDLELSELTGDSYD